MVWVRGNWSEKGSSAHYFDRLEVVSVTRCTLSGGDMEDSQAKSELTDDGVDRRKPGNEEKDEGMFASSRAFTRESETAAGDRSSDIVGGVDLAIRMEVESWS